MSSPTLGARIRAARSILGMTQKILATKLGFDTTSSISQWERDAIVPNQENLELLQKHLFDPARRRQEDADQPKLPVPPKPVAPKPHSKEQLILSAVELSRNTTQHKFVEDLLLGAKAQGYTIDSLLALLKQIKA